MSRPFVGLALSLALAGCGGGGGTPSTPSPSGSPPTATPTPPSATLAIFNQGVLHDVRLSMDPGDWQALRDNFRSNQYYAANITLDSETYNQVGIRSRGAGSRDATTPGLEVDFNRYVPTQEFHGYKRLSLDNHTTDTSMLRERLAFTVFEAMGISAPQLAHTRFTVNGEYWGVYSVVESISKPFLQARFGEESGALFDYEYLFPYGFEWRGPDPAAYIPVPFQPETNENRPETGPNLVEFVRAINQTPDASFVSTMSGLLDVDRFLAYVAVENAIAEYDGFVGDFGMNNLFLYRFGGQSRFVFIPWDKDSSFQAPAWPIFHNVDANVLTRRLLEDPGKRKVYTDAVLRAAQSYVNTRYLTPRLETAYSQIRSAVQADTKKPYTNADFEGAVGGLRGVIAAREADVQSQAP